MANTLLVFLAGVVVGWIVVPRILPNLKAAEQQLIMGGGLHG